MKRIFLLIMAMSLVYVTAHAQDAYSQQMQTAVTKLDNAKTVKDYQLLADNFLRIADGQKDQWLPYYYAAFCNAKIGWLKQNDDPDNIEPFANKAAGEIKKAGMLIDTAKQKKELAELYCIHMMLNQARVFINPQTYGREYGPTAFNYLQMAKQADPDNPRMLYLLGWQKFATPKMWGGDKAQAKQLLTNAKQKLAGEPSAGLAPHWGKKEVEEILEQLK
ncbi:hypothetical protein [Niastella sp. OAS944]|uniref:hypothetical protein n=1 Tax=Niastella sp. OAS944 TaxID=2664089 RepID=UPI003488728F|nr:hypothetical protein [Chitinophagaceae bacterium OAS944]